MPRQTETAGQGLDSGPNTTKTRIVEVCIHVRS
jgi:hypothetical protein